MQKIGDYSLKYEGTILYNLCRIIRIIAVGIVLTLFIIIKIKKSLDK